MPEAVMAHLEIQTPVKTKITSGKQSDVEQQSFSNELDKQIHQDEPVHAKKVQDKSEPDQAAKSDDEVTDEQTNLPVEEDKTDEIAESDDAETKAAIDAKGDETEVNVDSSAIAVSVPINDKGISHVVKEKPATVAELEIVDGTDKNKSTAINKVMAQTESVEVKSQVLSQSPQYKEAISVNKVDVDKAFQPNLGEVQKLAQQPPSLRADIATAIQKSTKNQLHENQLNQIMQSGSRDEVKPIFTKLIPSSDLAALSTTSTVSTGTTTSTPLQTVSQTSSLNLPVQPNINSAAWSQVMSGRVLWMAKEGVHEAQLTMTPASLGTIDVKMTVQNDQATVTFLAQNATTRDALEQALPKLRESFADNGLQLADSHVGQQGQENQETTQDDQGVQIFSQASDDVDDTNIDVDQEAGADVLNSNLSLYV